MTDQVELWHIIQDWLPTAGWEILRFRRPEVDMHGDMLPAFIYCDKESLNIKVAGPNYTYPQDKMCMIRGNEVVFFDTGDTKTLKATDPDFFTKLDEALLTLFRNAAWYQQKFAQPKNKTKIWPK